MYGTDRDLGLHLGLELSCELGNEGMRDLFGTKGSLDLSDFKCSSQSDFCVSNED